MLLLRCKSAVEPGALRSAFWTFFTCVLRVVFVRLGITAVLAGTDVVIAIAAYAIPAAVGTFIVHALDDQLEASRQRNNARTALASRRPKPTPAPPPKRKPWDGRRTP